MVISARCHGRSAPCYDMLRTRTKQFGVFTLMFGYLVPTVASRFARCNLETGEQGVPAGGISGTGLVRQGRAGYVLLPYCSNRSKCLSASDQQQAAGSMTQASAKQGCGGQGLILASAGRQTGPS